MTYISKCDLVVYDLHSGNPEDVQLALDAMYKPRLDDDPAQEKIIILISSLLAWDNTPRNLEEIRSPQEIEEEMKAKAEAEAKALLEAAKAEVKGDNEEDEDDSKARADVTSKAALSGDEGQAEGK